MKKAKLLLTLLLSLLGFSATRAAETVEPNIVVADEPADGAFSTSTVWYTLQIAASGFYLSDNGTAAYIALNKSLSEFADEDLWCIAGNKTDGYHIYNKQGGVTKYLASPITMTGTKGGTAYAILKEAGDANYCYLWDFYSSTSLSGKAGYYIAQHGTEANKLNNREGKLAFWTGGADGGSTIVLNAVHQVLTIDLTTGTFTATNTNGTYASVWTSSQNSPTVTLSTGANNMDRSGDNLRLSSGQSQSSVYTIGVPQGFYVKGYSFKCANSGHTNAVSISGNGQTVTTATETKAFAVEGLTEKDQASFTVAGTNAPILFSEFNVEIEAVYIEPEPQQNLYITNPGAKPYRIPAIATAPNGDIFAISDYRPCGADIGYGEVDIKCRISKDNGQTWGEEFFVADGEGDSAAESWKIGFGDAAVVADCERNELLVMSVCGKVVCWNGNYIPDSPKSNPNPVARTRARLNETTGEWEFSAPELVTESIYRLFVDENNTPTVQSLFIGSGRICQSRHIKVGDYYRLYCAIWTKNNGNRVIYSDDFGDTWKVLGSINDRPAPSGDEPKCEELPDGSVLLSSRVGGGRYFNIYSFSNSATGEGSWGSVATSNANNNGISIGGNSTNGEVMMVPAVRKATGEKVILALQSVPFGSSRSNVGIYYKPISSLSDFTTPATFAANWEGRHQSSYIGSAYSTMTLQGDNTIGFLYEEETFGAGYTIVYKNYTLEQITDDTYSYATDGVDVLSMISAGIAGKVAGVTANVGTNVGMLTEAGAESINNAVEAYNADPSIAAYEAVNRSIAEAEKVRLVETFKYRLRNKERASGTLYLTAAASEITASTLNEANESQLFNFILNEDGSWKIYNEAQDVYIGSTGAVETKTPVSNAIENAAPYRVDSSIEGKSALVCLSPTNASHPALHLAGDNTRIVPWLANSDASLWYIEPTDITTAIDCIAIQPAETAESYYDISGRRVQQPRNGFFITNSGRKLLKK